MCGHAFVAQLVQQRQPIHVRQTEIEKNDLILPGGSEPVTCCTIFRHVNGETGFFKNCGQQLLHGTIVIYQK